MRAFIIGIVFGGMALAANTTSSTPVTYNKDVLPILQKNCQSCHRPGQVAPMSFLTYAEVRPWVPAHPTNNVIEWSYITVPSGITEDTWITSMQIRPSEPSITHHICVFFKPHKADVKYNVPYWYDRKRDESGAAVEADAGINGRGIPDSVTEGTNGIEGCYVPGQFTQDYRIFNAGKLVKAGTDIVFQVHYTPNGKETTDRPLIGFTVAKQAPQRRYVSFGISAPSDPKHFAIPPNDGNWASPPAQAIFQQDVELVYMFPHMHVRGKDMTYKLEFPDGTTKTILSVPHYDFNWQLAYNLDQPIEIPKGTKLTVTAHYDNSANNKFNPDPNKTVYYGDMTWEEMMFPFFSIVVDKDADARKILKPLSGRANGA